jgi:hypothetical protein
MGGQVRAYVRGKTRYHLYVANAALKLDHLALLYASCDEKAELAVHKRKVEDVRRWLLEAFVESGPSAKLRKYRVSVCRWRFHRPMSLMILQRILTLTGPAGTAKTSTLHVLSRELDFEILEWRNSMSGPASLTDEEPHINGEYHLCAKPIGSV